MEPELSLLRDLAVIMAVAGAAIVLFRRLGQPTILGYLIAGILIGPFTFPHPPVEDVEVIRLLADLGLVLLLFALGLEFGWERIRQVGLRVLVIGTVEMGLMIAIGYQIGILLGWTGTEAIFLGSAMAISSSAVLVKMLRDTGRLHTQQGRLIIGILVVEDFAAVILLSILSGIATTGATDAGEIGRLVGKLAMFTAAALVLGALLAPRVVDFVAKFGSSEMLLISSLAIAFGLALIAEELGVSAAAGAFLIGAVLGDTRHAEEIEHVVSPLRDMFAAIFFVSVGMLVDVTQVTQFIVPAVIIASVFVAVKLVANTVGTFITGHDGRTSLRVGTGMPQTGEFSLAMVKVGADYQVVGANLYPVVAVTTAITSFVYPWIFKSADGIASFLDRRSPSLLQQYMDSLSEWLGTLSQVFSIRSEAAIELQHATRVIVINVAIIALLIAVGTILARLAENLSMLLNLSNSTFGLAIAGGVIALSVPSAVIIWRELQVLADALSVYLFRWRRASSRGWRQEDLRRVLRDTMLAVVTVLISIWAIPFLSQLAIIGRISGPLPVLVLVGMVFLVARSVFKVHAVLQDTFSRTFLGRDSLMSTTTPGSPSRGPAQEAGQPGTGDETEEGRGSSSGTEATEDESRRPGFRHRAKWRTRAYAFGLAVVTGAILGGFALVPGLSSGFGLRSDATPTVSPSGDPGVESVRMELPGGDQSGAARVRFPDSTGRGIGIERIDFPDLPSDARGGTIVASRVEWLDEASAPTPLIHRYVKVELHGVSAPAALPAEIVFTLPDSWMRRHEVQPEEVLMAQLTDGAWLSLETLPAGAEKGFHTFTAAAPELSLFAVGAAEASVE